MKQCTNFTDALALGYQKIGLCVLNRAGIMWSRKLARKVLNDAFWLRVEWELCPFCLPEQD